MNSRKFTEPRRKNDLHWLEAVVPSLGFVICLMLLFPPWREIILRMGVPCMSIGGTVFAGSVVVLVGRRVAQRASTPVWDRPSPGVERALRSFDLSTLKSVAGEEMAEAPAVHPSPEAPILPETTEPRRISLRLEKKPVEDAVPEAAPRLKISSTIPLLAREKKPAATSAPPDMLERLRTIDWFQFETVVGMMYERQGFTVTRRGGAGGEGGIDMELEKGGCRIAVQCKQWKNWQISEKSVHQFADAAATEGFAKGMLVLLSGCMVPARKAAADSGIEIVEERHLMEMLEAVHAENDTTVMALLNDHRKYCRKCESEMVLRTPSSGGSSTEQFWDCSSAPQCDYTLQISSQG